LKHFKYRISEYEIKKIFDAIDIDHSGFIDYTEFVVAASTEISLLTKERLIEAFKMFDKNSNGSITPDEIKFVLEGGKSNIPPAVIDAIIRQVDENGDGAISFEEFTHMM